MLTTLALIIAAFIAMLVLIFFELLIPSFGILTLMSLAAAAVAVWLGFSLSTTAGVVVIVAIVVVVPAYLYLLVKHLPDSKLGGKMFLKAVPSATGTGTPGAGEMESLVGQSAVAETLLRPSGMVRIGGKRVPAMAEGGYIQRGSTVKIISADGFNVVVRLVSGPPAEPQTPVPAPETPQPPL